MKSLSAILRVIILIPVALLAFASSPAYPGPAEVREIQQALTDMGYAPGPIDGAWGGKTEAAARKFMENKKLDSGSVFSTTGRDDGALLAHITSVRVAEKKAVEAAATRNAKGLALVIGNAGYKNVKALINPAKDAVLIAAALEAAGFLVTHLRDADQKTMKKAMHGFGRTLRDHRKPGFFYYAGHAIQVDGANYLVPLGANVRDEAEIAFEGVPLDAFLSTLKRETQSINMVVLDTYSQNPYSATFRSAERGFARAAAPRGTYLVLASSQDQDGAGSGKKFSPYTWALANAMLSPGIAVEEVFKKARRESLATAPNMPPPHELSSLTGDFSFVEAGAAVDLDSVLKIVSRADSLAAQLAGKTIKAFGADSAGTSYKWFYISKNGNLYILNSFSLKGQMKFSDDVGYLVKKDRHCSTGTQKHRNGSVHITKSCGTYKSTKTELHISTFDKYIIHWRYQGKMQKTISEGPSDIRIKIDGTACNVNNTWKLRADGERKFSTYKWRAKTCKILVGNQMPLKR